MLTKKHVSALFLFLICLSTFASSPQKDCRYSNLYRSMGWTIQPSENFEVVEEQIRNIVTQGLEDGTVVFDMAGIIQTHDSIKGEALLLHATMWDNLVTDKDTMYGDFAISNTVETNEAAEIRWFDGKSRNIIFNSKILKCFMEAPPYAENSVL